MPLDVASEPLVPPTARWPGRPLTGIALIRAMRRSMLSVWGPRAYELPIVHGKLYGRERILVNDPASIRRVLIENPTAYEKPAPTRRLTRPIIGEGVFLSEGQEWRRQRRVLSPAFTPAHVEQLTPHFAAAAEGLIETWTRQGRVQLFRTLQEAALDAASRSMFGLPIGGRGARIADLVRVYAKGPGRPNPFDMIAQNEGDFSWFTPGRRAFRRRWLKEVDQIVEARRAQGSGGRVDLLELLMAARDSETGEGLSNAEIRDQAATMLAAGFETTAGAMFWTLYLLARDLGEQARIRDEVRADPPSASLADVGRRWPRLRRAVLEALRLYPSAPLLFRTALEPDKLLDVDVPVGSIVIIAPWIVHRHRRLWDQPDAFIPDRFDGKER
ncbi:MAG TPA: cytochrome P450, partial [Caulobacteraceae bacterium]|nr:cytochrome P450 [Caulobacteraceae bacterium]